MKCNKCEGTMVKGKALEQTSSGIPDFVGDEHVCTVSAGVSGKLEDCMKCESCGWSVTLRG